LAGLPCLILLANVTTLTSARIVAVVCLIFVSFTYVAGQMRGVGIVFSRFLEVDVGTGVIIGMAVVFMYAVLGGMKGITYTQVAQYTVLIFAYMVPAIFISIMITGNPIPQLGFGSEVLDGSGLSVLEKLDGVLTDLGFREYTQGSKSTIDVIAITAALMFGTAGLPHVLVRFFTVPKVSDARKSAGYALVFIAILYTTAPAVASFARLNLVDTIHNTSYEQAPKWFSNWESTGLVGWEDKNNDGVMQYSAGSENEVKIDRDIMVLANPEIANLPGWVIALVAAGGVAAALSTAAGLLLVISSSISHDLLKQTLMPAITEKQELLFARIAAAVAVCIAGLFGIYPPAFVAQVVAFAFGLAAASLFPAILLGIFSKRMNKEGAVTGMLVGLITTFTYIVYFKFASPELNNADYWLLGISPEGIGFIGMLLNIAAAFGVSKITTPPSAEVQDLVDHIRIPSGASAAHNH
jgi:cation/acetate symporter